MVRALTADAIVIGSGIAGLRAALELAADRRVLVLTKSAPEEGSTGYAQGGIAAAVSPDDSPDLHAADTMAAGDGLCDAAAVRVLVEEGRHYVQELIDWGAQFDRDPNGAPVLAQEGAHSVRRVLHARDATGREIGRVLGRRLSQCDRVTLFDHSLAIQLMVDAGRVTGVRYLDAEGRLSEARADATLIATGGAGQVYRDTTNPVVATGDGVALAYWSGARVADLEFVQFHPTALSVAGAPRYLLSEALRGEGARLINDAGEPFMRHADPAGDLAPRDRVARAILREADRTQRPVYLSMAHLPAAEVRARFPHVTDLCRRAGLDLATDRIPVSPAAHYIMGGVETDLDGRTSLPGLFAAGEAACTGVHGANRLASNSLLEGLVFGARAGRAMRGAIEPWPVQASRARSVPPPDRGDARPLMSLDAARVQEMMWREVGVFRTRTGMLEALNLLEPAWKSVDAALQEGRALTAGAWRVASLITVGRLITRAALRREESRGAQWREDFPRRDDLHWTKHLYDELG